MFKKTKDIIKLILSYRSVKSIKIIVEIPCGTLEYNIHDESRYVLHRADNNGDYMGGTCFHGIQDSSDTLINSTYDNLKEILDDYSKRKT